MNEKIKSFWSDVLCKIGHQLQKMGFWVLLLLLVGMLAGAKVTSKIYDWRAQEAVKLQGVIIDNKIYDLKQRP